MKFYSKRELYDFVWSSKERKILDRLDSPRKIQDYLDSLGYDVKGGARSARSVMKEKKADCFGGALFAAAALKNMGLAPMLVELCAVNDDGHMLAVFQMDGWGAIARSNFTTLRYREPVYQTIRELVMSYFDFYFNTNGEKTLRSFSEPLLLKGNGWMVSDKSKQISDALDRVERHKILAKRTRLAKADPLLLKAGLLNSDPKGLFKPKKM